MSGKKYDQFFKHAASDDGKAEESDDGLEEALAGFAIPSGAVDAVMKLLPEHLPEGVKDAFLLSKQIGESDAVMVQAVMTARRLEMMANSIMTQVGEEHDITLENSPAGTYINRMVTAAGPDVLASYIQAMSFAFDQALLAFTEAFRVTHMLMTHPSVSVHVGVGEIKTVPDAQHEKLLHLQPERDRVRAMHIAKGLVELERLVKQGTLDETQLGPMVADLFKAANEASRNIPLPEEDGDDESAR